MREPAFWSSRDSLRSRLLAPLGALYALATARRLARGRPLRLGIPVVCIGNLNVGGTGKTPTVIATVEHLRNLGHVPHVVSRGYRGSLAGPVAVDPARHFSDAVGDEPLLLSAFAQTWVARDRAAGGRVAEADGATVVVLDDGFQNPELVQDLKLLVVDAARGFGNGRCIPAGPLREPVETGLARADALLTIGDAGAQRGFSTDLPPGLPRFEATLEPLETGMDWTRQRFFAFAGIAHPEKFFATLQRLGAELAGTVALNDHEPLGAALLARLERDAQSAGAQLVTTEKDAARLPRDWRGKVLTLPVRLRFSDEPAFRAFLKRLPRQ